MLRNKSVDIYFYDGSDKPQRLGKSIQDLMDHQSRIIQTLDLPDARGDDLIKELLKQIERYLRGETHAQDFKYSIFADPTLEDFMKENEKRGLPAMANLEDARFSQDLVANKKRTFIIKGLKKRDLNFDDRLVKPMTRSEILF